MKGIVAWLKKAFATLDLIKQAEEIDKSTRNLAKLRTPLTEGDELGTTQLSVHKNDALGPRRHSR